jgi:Skp family chaperone for outer membrane proteins
LFALPSWSAAVPKRKLTQEELKALLAKRREEKALKEKEEAKARELKRRTEGASDRRARRRQTRSCDRPSLPPEWQTRKQTSRTGRQSSAWQRQITPSGGEFGQVGAAA